MTQNRKQGSTTEPPRLPALGPDEERVARVQAGLRVLESAADCIEVLDLEARLEFMNDGGLGAMEVEDFATLRGVRWTDFWKGDDHAKALAAVQAARQGETGRFEGYAPTLKGTPRWWDVVVTPIRGPDGQPEQLLVISRDVSASKQAEATANGDQRELQALADALPVLVAYVDADRRYRFTNRTYERWFPDRPRGIAGRSVREVVGEDAYALFAPWIERALSGEAVSFEQLLPYSDGPARHLRMEYVPRITEDGVQGFYGLAYDISEQKRIEAELRDSATQLSVIFAQAAVGLSQVSLEGRPMRVNDELCRMLGRDRQAVLVGGIAGITHPDDLPTSLAAFRSVVETGRTVSLDKRYLRPDGTVVWANSSLTRLNDENGRPHSVLVVTVDLTERKLIEERLRELNATLEARVAARTAERDRAWKNSRDLLLVTDMAGVVRAVNPAWTDILGWREEELVGHSFLEFVHPDDIDPSFDALERAASENLAGFQNRYRHRDGSCRWISWVTAREGPLIYASGRDKTADRARDAQLQAAQEALRHSQKMEAMGQLTGGVAHDFNNLLTPIMGTLDLLQHGGMGTEREQRFIAAAMQSAERAKLLVQRLLAFARRQPLQATAVDVASLIGGMVDLIARANGPQISVVVEAEPGLPLAHADPNELEMALLNLAVNARDAMPQGGSLRIAAELEQVGSGHRANLTQGRYIRLSVTDTGVGMDEATLARAVEPFFSTKGVGKGTGLGLSSAHGLASQLGGALLIQSQRGVGTQVEMWLPVSSMPVETAGPVAEASAGGQHVGSALLVDDEELVRMSTADMLVSLGYAVSECPSAEAALALIRGGLRPDVLVTDHLMPGMTGTELARRVRSEHPEVGILLVSGYAEAEGVAPHLTRLTKPFRKNELARGLAAVRRAEPHTGATKS